MAPNHLFNHQCVLNNRWLFDAAQNCLVDLDGRIDTVVLKPVATRILTLLVDAPRMLLRRQQLLDEGWRAFGFEVCENSLNQVMCSLRGTFEALDPGQAYIKTIPRVGYCFLAEVRTPTVDDLPVSVGMGTDASPIYGGTASALLDRYAFDQLMAVEWRRAQRSGLPLSMLMIGVSCDTNFSRLDQSATGGDPLARIAQCIAGDLHRSADRVALYGNSRFVALLPDTSRTGANAVARKILASLWALEWPSLAGPIQLELTANVGITCTDSCCPATPYAFVEACSASLDEAKHGDRTSSFDHACLITAAA
ncbi:diguanylate cyclase domain-containing protein [Trinickia acidisoli]|uniref:diguanylate cyclase domain-containing protein n=1 Tax=Trinickia acidisoli TaxID=2767482 RepID=UPI001A8CF6F0|nr:diguanylate cyclase [Trinickia acidisoli]